ITPIFTLAYLLFPPLEMARFPIKLLVPAALLLALLECWGLDGLRNASTAWSWRRSWIINPLSCLLLVAIFCLSLSFLAPDTFTRIAQATLGLSNQVYWHVPQDSFSAAQAANGARFLLTMVRIYFPGLTGILLGGLLWFIGLEQKKPWAYKSVPVVAFLGIAHLAWINYGVNPTVPKAFYTYRPPALSEMEPAQQPYRICPLYRKKPLSRHATNVQAFLNFKAIPFVSRLPLVAQNDFRSRLVLSHATMLTGADVILNNDVDLSFPTDLFHFWVFIGAQMPDYSRSDCLIGRTNVRYEIFDHRQQSRSLQLVGRVFNASPVPSYLYANLCAMPRAYVASAARYSSSPLATLTLLSAPGFDANHQVILSRSERHVLKDPGLGLSGQDAGTVTILEDEPNSVVLRAHMVRPGYVVLLDRYDPDWRAFVDGQPAPILRANLMFRAIQLERGDHWVRFEYHQLGLKAGLAISVLALMLLVGLYATDRVRINPLMNDC
ncbi:MAG: YfhO family protein, partial [Terriglobia bacterium]